MKKRFTRLFSLILIIIMAFILTACSTDEEKSASSAKEFYYKGVDDLEKSAFDKALKNFTSASKSCVLTLKNEKSEVNLDEQLDFYIRSLYFIGDIYTAKNDTENAKTAYLEALKEDMKYDVNEKETTLYRQMTSIDYYKRMNAQLLNNDYESALKTIEQSINCDDKAKLQDMLYEKIVIYENMYKWEDAYKALEEYKTFYPEDKSIESEEIFLSTR